MSNIIVIFFVTCRFQYVLNGGIEDLDTILIYISPYDDEVSNTKEIVASYEHSIGQIECKLQIRLTCNQICIKYKVEFLVH